MKRALLFVFLVVTTFLFSLQWPVDDPNLIGSFGAIKERGLDVGVHLQGSRKIVEPYQKGELIFMAPSRYGSANDSGLIVLQHDDGFRSCYGEITPDSNMGNRTYLNEDDQLGVWSDGFRFSIRDSRLNSWVNPLYMFTNLEDKFAPQVEGIFIKSDKGIYELNDESIVPAGNYELLLRVSDILREEGTPLMPDQVKVSYLGRVIFSLSFESLTSRDGVLYFDDSGSASSLFYQGGLINAGTISVSQGKGFLEVEVTDYRGNKSVKEISMNRPER